MDDIIERMNRAYKPRKVNAVFYDCPYCGGKRAVPVVPGYPDELMMQECMGKVIELGGCIIDGKMSNRACPDCKKQWTAQHGEGTPRVVEMVLPPLPPPKKEIPF